MNVAMIGLGKLGLPVSCAMTQRGHTVYGYDIDPRKGSLFKAGQCSYYEPDMEGVLQAALSSGLYICDTVADAVTPSEIVFIAVPTPSKLDHSFDTSYVEDALTRVCQAILDVSRSSPCVISIISTVLPGTCRSTFIPIIEQVLPEALGSGWVCFCYNAQFIAMGTTVHDFLDPEFVLVGEYDRRSGDILSAFYTQTVNAPVLRMSLESAETTKMCYSADTEVLTDKGWRLFSGLEGDEQVFSLNPETMLPEWLPYLEKIEAQYDGDMYHFYSKKDDMLVTPEHRMLLGTMTSRVCKGKKTYPYRWRLEPAREVVTHKSFVFQRHTEWNGIHLDKVALASAMIDTSTYAEFMAWFLAEGCVNQISTESYQIIISQSREGCPDKYKRIRGNIVSLMEQLDADTGIYEHDYGMVFYHRDLGRFLLQFGLSRDKYVPQIIKELDRDAIRLFLDVYNLADGSSQPSRRWGSGEIIEDRKSSIYYATVSDQMAADLGEMIIKVGKFPSYRVYNSPKSGRPCHLVYELRGKTSSYQESSDRGLKFKKVPYNGQVYCLVLPRNHVFLTRRNGKCTWQGNSYNCYIGSKLIIANAIMELCHNVPGADCDVVSDALSRAYRRILGPRYMKGGMGDGGNCHGRDNLALSFLAQRLDLSADPFAYTQQARDDQSRGLARLVSQHANETGLPVAILGITFKPETNLTDFSAPLLLGVHLQELGISPVYHDPIVQPTPLPNTPHLFVIAMRHGQYRRYPFPPGSTIIDPWRMLSGPPDGCTYIPIGRNPLEET